MTEEKIKNIIETALEERSRVDIATHSEHHEFIQRFIEEQDRKQEMWETIKSQVLGWGIIAIVGTLGTVVAHKFGFNL